MSTGVVSGRLTVSMWDFVHRWRVCGGRAVCKITAVFFINAECAGIWNMVQPGALGEFGTSVYEHVFELLLRLKGNYLWPAIVERQIWG